MNDLMIFWLPIIGTAIFLPLAMTEAYAGRRRRAGFLGAFGIICLVAVAVVQIVTPSKERPMIGVDGFRMDDVAIGRTLATQAILTNRGTQPALQVRAMVTGIITTSDRDPPGTIDRIPEQVMSVATMMPGATTYTRAVNQQKVTNDADVRVITKGEWVPWITGRVEYQDQLGHRYFTTFRAFYDYKTATYLFANRGNDAN